MVLIDIWQVVLSLKEVQLTDIFKPGQAGFDGEHWHINVKVCVQNLAGDLFFLPNRKLVKGWEETMKNTHVHFFGGHGDNFLVMTVRTVPMNQCLNCRFWLHEIPP